MINTITTNPQQVRLAALSEVTPHLGSTRDLDELLNLVMDTVSQLTGAEHSYLILHHVETGKLETTAARHGDQQSGAGRSLEISPAIVRRAITEEQSILIANTQADPRFAGNDDASDLTPGSIMCAPLRAGGCVIGAIYVANHSLSAAFVPEDLEFLEAFAGQVALALENVRLHDALQSAQATKNEFVSAVTHELRLPMTSIGGYTDLLLQQMMGPLNEHQIELLMTVRRNAERMNILIRDLSDINRLETGRLRLELKPLDLAEVINQVADEWRESIHQRQQTLELDISPSLPPVYADRTRLAQILSNLITNAHSYTPAGGQITICARSTAPLANDSHITNGSHATNGNHGGNGNYAPVSHAAVSVTDNGIGIAPADLELVFTPFFRSESAAVREVTGWGLGLSLVKMLVAAHDGQIFVESELDAGSTFTFTIPLADEAKKESGDGR